MRTSMVGSSWNSADTIGEAPIRSPWPTMTELRTWAWRFLMWVALYAAPPAVTCEPSDSVTRPEEPDGGSMFPCRSLMPIRRTSTVRAALSSAWAGACARVRASPDTAASASAAVVRLNEVIGGSSLTAPR